MALFVFLWIFSDDSAANYTFLVSCKSVRCLFITLLIVLFSRAGDLLIILDGKFGFPPYTIWYGLNPCTFTKQFFAFTAQHVPVSNEITFSSLTFLMIFVRIALWHSTIPFDYGELAAVVLSDRFNFLAISWKDLLNSRPILVKRQISGVP